MLVELNREQLLQLLRGTGGPASYSHPFHMLGKITGFPNEYWGWNNAYLNTLNEAQIWNYYQELTEFNSKS